MSALVSDGLNGTAKTSHALVMICQCWYGMATMVACSNDDGPIIVAMVMVMLMLLFSDGGVYGNGDIDVVVVG